MNNFIERAEYERDLKMITDVLERVNSVGGSIQGVVQDMVELHEKTVEAQRLQLDIIKLVAFVLFGVVVLLLGYIWRNEPRGFLEWVHSYWVEFLGLTKKEKLTVFIIPVVVTSVLLNIIVKISSWSFHRVTGL